MVAAHSKPGRDTLSSQIAREEWSLLVVAKRLASSVKGSSHYSLPFHSSSTLCTPPLSPLTGLFLTWVRQICARRPKSGTKPPCAPKQGLTTLSRHLSSLHRWSHPDSRPSERAIGRSQEKQQGRNWEHQGIYREGGWKLPSIPACIAPTEI